MKELLNEEKLRKDRRYGRRRKKDDEAQSQRFVDMAEELNADKTGTEFKKTIKESIKKQ